MTTAGIRWGRIILFGFLAEIAVLVLLAPVYLVSGLETAQYAVTVASFLGVFALAFLAARTLDTHRVLHGFLVGAAAIAVYYALGLIGEWTASLAGAEIPEQTPPPAYLYPLAHALKLIGGAAGGALAQRRQTRRAVSGAAVLP